jgi:small subunit ribosomal protein S5
MTDAGRRSKFRAVVAVGNRDGLVGVGSSKAKQVHQAIQKAINRALLNIAPVRRGCGSWECGCGASHSLLTVSEGRGGSVKVILKPAPRGLGIVAGNTAKIVLELAGIQDVWAIAFGETRTPFSFALAVYDALRNTYKIVSRDFWAR